MIGIAPSLIRRASSSAMPVLALPWRMAAYMGNPPAAEPPRRILRLSARLVSCLVRACFSLIPRRQPRRPHHGHGAWRLCGDLGGDAAEQRTQYRGLPGAQYNVIDMVDGRELQDGGRGIDRFQHMHSQPAFVEF